MFIKENYRKVNDIVKNVEDKVYSILAVHYIKGVHFPALKQDLLTVGKKNSAPKNIMNMLNQFREKKYQSEIDIAREVKRLESLQSLNDDFSPIRF